MNRRNHFRTGLMSFLFMISFGFISECDAQANDDSVKIEIRNLGTPLNSAFADYTPVISADGHIMIFTSRKPVSEKDKKKKKESFENIYLSTFNPKTGAWSDGKRLPDAVNEPERNNAAIGLSNDGQILLLYRDNPEVENGYGDIYQSTLVGEEWTKAVKLPSPVNTPKWETSGSFSPDGKTLYFVSNRAGGKGGRDIWMCRLDQKKWGKAENLGLTINTREDEASVFMHPDGKTLFFSSKGRNGLGGFDIYKSTWEGGKWSTPQNLGAPINTTEDDAFFVITADGKTGYYASAKAGGIGEKDIYEIKFTYTEKKKDTGPKLTLFSGMVIDKETNATLGSDIEISDNEKNEVISTIKSNSNSGKFLISLPSGKNYGITVKKDGYLFYSDNLTIPDTAAFKEIIKTIPLEKIVIGSKIVLANIFYDFDRSTLRPESMSELDRLTSVLKENPTLKIELSSHTDSKGSDDYNLKLSQSRAQSVVDFLITKGINKERLTAKGYGESKPIATNETEEGRQMNRRSEFEILSK